MADTARTQPLPAAGTSATHDLRVEAQAYTGRSTPRTAVPGATSPASAGDGRPADLQRGLPDPVAAAKDPDNRAKLLLATAAMTLLNLLLLLAVLANVTDPRPEQVIVDGTPCIVSEQDGQNVLYCQR